MVPAGRLKGAEQGVDVAAFQHPGGKAINWATAHAAGIRFAGVKVTEGAYYRNPYALADLANARAAGVSVAAYAFAIPNGNGASSSPVQQADYLLSHLGKLSRSVPIMLDIEYNPYGLECYGLGARAIASWISAFNREIKARTGSKPIMYIPVSWWATCTRGHVGFGQRPLWVPYYSATATRPPLPAGWTTWSIWQYSSTGTVRGIPAAGNTDLDQANPAVPTGAGPPPLAVRPTEASQPGIRGLARNAAIPVSARVDPGFVSSLPWNEFFDRPGSSAVMAVESAPGLGRNRHSQQLCGYWKLYLRFRLRRSRAGRYQWRAFQACRGRRHTISDPGHRVPRRGVLTCVRHRGRRVTG